MVTEVRPDHYAPRRYRVRHTTIYTYDDDVATHLPEAHHEHRGVEDSDQVVGRPHGALVALLRRHKGDGIGCAKERRGDVEAVVDGDAGAHREKRLLLGIAGEKDVTRQGVAFGIAHGVPPY